MSIFCDFTLFAQVTNVSKTYNVWHVRFLISIQEKFPANLIAIMAEGMLKLYCCKDYIYVFLK